MLLAGPALEWHQKEEEYKLELVSRETRNKPPTVRSLVAVFGVT